MQAFLQKASILLVLPFFLISTLNELYGQIAFNYQAVVRDADGAPISDKEMMVVIMLREGHDQGDLLYEEEHLTETNQFGIINLKIGRGMNPQGDLSEIDWGTAAVFMEVQIEDAETGIMQPLGVSELLSVPYALYSMESGTPGPPGPEGPQGPQGERGPAGSLPDGSEEGMLTYWDGSEWVVDSANLFHDGQNVGIGTSAPGALLHIHNTDAGGGNVLFTGEFNASPGNAPAEGSGTRMMWYPDKSAFRAGTVDGNHWDTDNIGNYSVAFGNDTRASGTGSVALGNDTEASRNQSMAWGSENIATADQATAWGRFTEATGFQTTAWGWEARATGARATAWGRDTEASGQTSTAWGFGTVASGVESTAWGGFTTAPSLFETALGRYNTNYVPNTTTTWDSEDRLFVIGNGTSPSNRSDAVVLLKNGNLGIGISTPVHKLAIPVTTKAANEEAGGEGIGIVNTESENFWNIHMTASSLRFSYNGTTNGSRINEDGEYIQNSDKRFKTNIANYSNVLDRVSELRVMEYNYLNQSSERKNIGFIAQDVLPVFPELVTADDDYLGINYSGFSVVAIKAIQEQQKQIEEQQVQIDALITENKKLRERAEASETQTAELLKAMQREIQELRAEVENPGSEKIGKRD